MDLTKTMTSDHHISRTEKCIRVVVTESAMIFCLAFEDQLDLSSQLVRSKLHHLWNTIGFYDKSFAGHNEPIETINWTTHASPLMRRFHQAVMRGDNSVTVRGSGRPMREFLHVDDMAAASVHVMDLDQEIYQRTTSPMLSHINVGTGVDCTIRELAETMAEVTGFHGDLVFDTSKSDGTPRKLMDVSKLKQLGWTASISLHQGLADTYAWFLANEAAQTD